MRAVRIPPKHFFFDAADVEMSVVPQGHERIGPRDELVFESVPRPNVTMRNVNKTGFQDSGKGNCSGCGCGFRLRTNAEISVMTSPIEKG